MKNGQFKGLIKRVDYSESVINKQTALQIFREKYGTIRIKG